MAVGGGVEWVRPYKDGYPWVSLVHRDIHAKYAHLEDVRRSDSRNESSPAEI